MNQRYTSVTDDIIVPIEAVNSEHTITSFLNTIKGAHDINFTITSINRNDYQHCIKFEVKGFENEVNGFLSKVETAVDNWKKKSFKASNYKVKNLHIKNLENDSFIIELNTHRFSGIKKFINNIYNHFNIRIGLEEKSELFNKNLKIQVKGTPEELTQFKSIFHTYVKSKTGIKLDNLNNENTNITIKVKQFRY